MPDNELKITIEQTPDGVKAELWCPAYVDHTEEKDAEDALAWALARVERGGDPFAEYAD